MTPQILPVEVALSAFTINTYGLPDRNFLDSDGKVSEEILQKRLGFSRKYRRFLSNNKKKFNTLSLYSTRKSRAYGFCYQTKAYRKSGFDFLTQGDERASWETLVFQEFLPKWHLLQREYDQHESLDNLRYEESEKQFLLQKNFKQYAGQEGTAAVFLSSIHILDNLNIEILKWPIIDDEQKSLLADVAFGLFTVFGPDVLKELVAKQPDLLNYYTYIVKTGIPKAELEKYSRIEPVSDRTPSMLNEQEEIHTAEDFFQSLITLAKAGLNSLHSIGIKT